MQAELAISNLRGAFPISGTCSACGETMLLKEPQITAPQQDIELLAEQFRLHVSQKHPPLSEFSTTQDM
jgi:hypothetical protein